MKKDMQEMIAAVSRETGVSMYDTHRVIETYRQLLGNRLVFTSQKPEPLRFGVLSLDAMLSFRPGITVIYSQSDIGKTSLAKRIALSLVLQGKTVCYYDAEGKMFLHDKTILQDVVFVDSDRYDVMLKLITMNVLDCIIVDTVTSVNHSRVHAFLTNIRASVPYIVLVAQMRLDIKSNKSIPACSDTVLSSAHTLLYLTESEKITVESVDMKRVQYAVSKYEGEPDKQGKRDSFIIRNNIVDNRYGAYDILHATGVIRSFGPSKKMDGEPIGQISEMVRRADLSEILMSRAMREKYGLTLEDFHIYAGNNEYSVPVMFPRVEEEIRTSGAANP
jgi:hypothetical protein